MSDGVLVMWEISWKFLSNRGWCGSRSDWGGRGRCGDGVSECEGKDEEK